MNTDLMLVFIASCLFTVFVAWLLMGEGDDLRQWISGHAMNPDAHREISGSSPRLTENERRAIVERDG